MPLNSSLRASSIAVVVVVAVASRKATTLVLLLRVVTIIGDAGILDATNPVVNVVDVVISDDDVNVSLVNKKRTADDFITAALVAVELIAPVVDTSMLAKDSGVAIVMKTLGI